MWRCKDRATAQAGSMQRLGSHPTSGGETAWIVAFLERHRSWLRCLIGRGYLGLRLLNPHRPSVPYIRQHRPDVVVAQLAAKRRHVAFIAIAHYHRDAQVGQVEEIAVGMVPGVAGLVVGRGGIGAVWFGRLPVGLPLKLGAMTGGASFRIDFAALLHIGFVMKKG